MRHLSRLSHHRKGEGKPLLLLVAYSFFFGATVTLIKTARDTYFLSRFDVSYLPLMFLAAACAVALATPVYNMILSRIGVIPAISWSGLIFAAFLLPIQSYLQGGFIPVLYVWVEIINNVINVQFWALAGMVFDSRQNRRLIGALLVGSSVASVMVGAGIKPFVERVGSDYLLTVAAGTIACCILMARAVKPYALRGGPGDTPSDAETGGARPLRGYLKMIAIVVGTAAMATVIIEYQFLMFSKEIYPSEEGLATFFGRFYAFAGAVSLFIQIFFTVRLVDWFDIFRCMLILPFGLGVGSFTIFIFPLIYSFWIARFVEQVTKFTVNKASHELAWSPVPPDQKQKAKLLIDGTIRTGMQGVTGILIYMLVEVWHLPYPFSVKILSPIALGSFVVCYLSTRRLKSEYPSALMSAIVKRRIDFEGVTLDTTDSHTVETIQEVLDSSDEAQQVFVLGAIEDLSLSPWDSALERLFRNGSPAVQQKILSMAAEETDILSDEQLREKIDERGPLAGDAIIIAAKRGMTCLTPALRRNLRDAEGSSADIRAASAVALLLMKEEPLELAGSILRDLLDSRDASRNALALQMIGHVPSLLEVSQLREYLGSESIGVCMAALGIAQRRKEPQLLPGIVRSMKHPAAVPTARGVLRAYPAEDVVTVLGRICGQPGTPSRLKIGAARVLRDYPSSPAIVCLLRMLELSSPHVQSEIVATLCRIAGRTRLPADILRRFGSERERIAREIYARYELLNMTVAGPDGLLLRDLFENNIQRSTPVLFALLLLNRPKGIAETCLDYLRSEDASQLGYIVEILENTLRKKERGWAIPLLKPMSVGDMCRIGHRLFSDLPRDMDDELLLMVRSPREWHAAVALDYAIRQDYRSVLEQIDWGSLDDDGLGQELVSRHLAQSRGLLAYMPQIPRGRFSTEMEEDHMLSTLEKTIILKGTEMFGDSPGEDIYHAAQMMEEKRLDEGDLLFQEGDSGDYLYIIVTGEVLIHIADEKITRLHKGDHVGEMALLDDSPRSTSATALEETLLLKMSQDSFLDVMMDHREVGKGIMKILSKRSRSLTNELVEMRQRLRATTE